jgi:hypothetical protein
MESHSQVEPPPALVETETLHWQVAPDCFCISVLMFTGRSLIQVEPQPGYDLCRLCGDNTWKKVCVVVTLLWRLLLLM